MLYEFLTVEREEIIERCRAKVLTRRTPRPTDEELEHGVPMFLDQLIDTLRRDESATPAISEDEGTSEIGASATKHGSALLQMGFTVDQVVHDYGDICQTVTELAVEQRAPISNQEFRTLNRCLDDAIARAVTEHERQRDEAASAEGTERTNERLGALAHEFRNLVSTATLAFDALQSGSVGINGSTGTVLGRTLGRMRALVDRSLTEIRLDAGIVHREHLVVASLIDEIEAAAILEAKARGIHLNVFSVDEGVTVDADRQILGAVLENLLQNAFKFTRPRGHVSVQIHATADRVLIDIVDECGGLPEGKAEELFRPFEQRGADRTGVGLGLAISSRGVEAHDGTLSVGNMPGVGCVFTVDLPRKSVPGGRDEFARALPSDV